MKTTSANYNKSRFLLETTSLCSGLVPAYRKRIFGNRRLGKILGPLGCIYLLSGATPAMAQLQSDHLPPAVQFLDQHKVDLKSGDYVHSSPTLGAGAKDAPAISYAPIDINTNTTAGTPLIGWVLTWACPSPNDGECTPYFSARLGNKVVNFLDDGTQTLFAFTGERMVFTDAGATIYDQDDTAWYMDGTYRATVASGNPPQQIQTGTLKKIIYRDGRELDYVQNAALDLFVFSNEGYELVVRNGQSNVKLINLANDYCDTASTQCDTSNQWPTFIRSFTVGQNGNYSDPLNYITTFSSTIHPGGADGGSGTDNTINYPSGRWEVITKLPTRVYTGSFSSVDAMVVVSHQDNRSSATYSYTADINGAISSATGSYSDGTTKNYTADNPSVQDNGSITDEINRTKKYSFSNGYLANWSNVRAQGLVLSAENPEHDKTSWLYNLGLPSSWTLAGKVDPNQTITSSSTYDASCTILVKCHQPNTVTDPRGNITNYTYDSTSQMLSVVKYPAVNGVRREVHYTFQQRQAVYKQSTAGTPTASGKPIWKIVRTSECRTLAYPACVGTADEIVKTWDYNGNLLPITETTSDGTGVVSASVTRDFDSNGNVIWEDGPLSGTVDRTYFFWDKKRQLVGEIHPDPDGTGTSPSLPRLAMRQTLNTDGLPTLIEAGTVNGTARADLDTMTVTLRHAKAYDVFNDLMSEDVEEPDGTKRALTQYSYDDHGRLICTAVRMNPAGFDSPPSSACSLGSQGAGATDFGPDRITKNVYDAAGQLVQVRRAYGIPSLEQPYVTYGYTPNGKQEFVIDANGNRAQQTYDQFDRKSGWYLPSKTLAPSFNGATQATALATAGAISGADQETYEYDAAGNLLTRYLRNSTPTAPVKISYTYDALNRLLTKTLPAGTPNLGSTYSYDLQGHLISMANTNGTWGTNTVYSFDALGNELSEAESLTSAGATTTHTISSTYDVAGNRKTRSWDGAGFYVGYNYDFLNRMTDINEVTMIGGATVNLIHFDYDNLGRRQKLTRSNGTSTEYLYDGVSRLVEQKLWTGTTTLTNDYKLTYTPAGQVSSKTQSNSAFVWTGASAANVNYAINGLNQYTVAGSTNISYDPKGNLTSAPTAMNPSTYSYNAENELATQDTTNRFYYDPHHRLVFGTQNGFQLLYDGDQVAEEFSRAGSVTRRYVFGPDPDEPLIWYESMGKNQKRWLTADPQGSIVSVADSSGSPLALNSYDEYGMPATSNATYAGRFRYTGQQWITELGMYYYKARIYSPYLGRFLQTDPIGYGDQVNLYSYVGNDPVSNADPSGNLCAMLKANFGYTCGGDLLNNPEADLKHLGSGSGSKSHGAEETASQVAGALGTAATGVQYGSGRTTVATNRFRMPYFKGFRGNQYITTKSLAKLADFGGRGLFVAGTVFDAISVGKGNMSVGKFGENFGFGALGVWGGPPGAAVSVSYFAAEAFYPGGSKGMVRDMTAAEAKEIGRCHCDPSPDYFDRY